MIKYKLTKGEEEDKNTINLNNYCIGELYTVKPEIGYFNKKDMRIGLSDFMPWDKIEQEPGKCKKIIFDYYCDLGSDIPSCGNEFLTKEVFPILFMRSNRIILNKAESSFDEFDAFIYLKGKLRHPTTDEMWAYIIEHEDTERYKEELNNIKRMSNIYHEDREEFERKEACKDKVLIKRIK